MNIDILGQQLVDGFYRISMNRDGVVGIHVLHQDTLMIRAAEYGLDINDAELLMEVVLREPYLGIQHTDSDFVYRCSESDAQSGLMDKISRNRTTTTISDPQGYLTKICSAHRARIDQQAFQTRKSMVAGFRKSGMAAAAKQ